MRPVYTIPSDQGHGLDREVRQKIASSYDVREEDEVRAWIVRLLKNDVFKDKEGGLMDQIQDGVILCQLAERVTGQRLGWKASRMSFVQMENISLFLQAAEAIGVPPQERFMTIDLYEKKVSSTGR